MISISWTVPFHACCPALSSAGPWSVCVCDVSLPRGLLDGQGREINARQTADDGADERDREDEASVDGRSSLCPSGRVPRQSFLDRY